MSLVTTPYLRVYWVAAVSAPESEQESVEFWHEILTRSMFAGKPDISVFQESHPATGDKRKVDLVVKKIVLPSIKIHILCFVEVKKPNAPQSLIDEVEGQAITACMSYTIVNNMEFVYAMTAIGTTARLWYYEKGADYLTPMHGGGGLSDQADYIEANSTEAHILLHNFHRMLAEPPVSSN
ncbi:MAG: hypothetical protein Q9216_006734 [Gyalolechia sp. 2 TL-2023]